MALYVASDHVREYVAHRRQHFVQVAARVPMMSNLREESVHSRGLCVGQKQQERSQERQSRESDFLRSMYIQSSGD